MKIKSLMVLMRLRQVALDEARLNLSEAINEECKADAVRREIEQSIEQDANQAANSLSDMDVESFACWLRHAHSRLEEAKRLLQAASHRAAVRRANLTLARAAAESVAMAISGNAKEAWKEIICDEQRSINEISATASFRSPAQLG